MKKIGGTRRKSRYKLTKDIRRRGKISISRYFQQFQIGDRVSLSPEASFHKGMYHQRFIGKSGIVAGTQGFCYKIEIKDKNKKKMLIVHPVHLKNISFSIKK